MAVTCRHVRQLHDAYLDGDLSASMNAEVHAHLLQCPACQQQVETVRACGDVIANDRSEPRLSGDFATRVLAELPAAPVLRLAPVETRRTRRMRLLRGVMAGAMPAIAASLVFAVLLGPQIRVNPNVVAGIQYDKQPTKIEKKAPVVADRANDVVPAPAQPQPVSTDAAPQDEAAVEPVPEPAAEPLPPPHADGHDLSILEILLLPPVSPSLDEPEQR